MVQAGRLLLTPHLPTRAILRAPGMTSPGQLADAQPRTGVRRSSHLLRCLIPGDV
jgi:hypothetical protein